MNRIIAFVFMSLMCVSCYAFRVAQPVNSDDATRMQDVTIKRDALTLTNTIHIAAIGQSNMRASVQDNKVIKWPTVLLQNNGVTNTFISYYQASGKLMDGYVREFWDSELGPDIFGGYSLAHKFDFVYISKMAEGGSAISRFEKASADLYPQILASYTNTQVNTSSNAGPVDVIWWGQGEQDWGNTNYLAQFTQLMADLKTDIGTASTKIVIMGLGASYQTSPAQAALKAYAAANPDDVVFVDNSDLETRDGTHYTAQEQVKLGYRMAAATEALYTGMRTSDGVYAPKKLSAGTVQSEAVDANVVRAQEVSGTKLMMDGTDLAESFTTGELIASNGVVNAGTMVWNGRFGYMYTNTLNRSYVYRYEKMQTPNNGYGYFAKFYGFASGGGTQVYQHSVKLLNTMVEPLSGRTVSIRFMGTGLYWQTLGAAAIAEVMFAQSQTPIEAYGSLYYPSDSKKRWSVTFNEAVSITAGDTVVCGSNGTRFIADADSTGTTAYIRDYWNPNASSDTFVPMDTNTPVIVSGSTNATAHIVSHNMADISTDFRWCVYAASDGWYTVPRYYGGVYYEIATPIDDTWAFAE